MPKSTCDQPQGATLRGWRPGRSAFTLIELLVVMGIIAVLVAILVLVGGRVAGTGKQSATLSVIKTLDAAVGAVVQERGRLPRALARDPRSETNLHYWPVADAAIGEAAGAPLINSGGWFLHMASEFPGAVNLTAIDAELLRPFSPTPAGSVGSSPDESQPMLTTPMDGWGNPIRFVHPDFHGNMRNRDPETAIGPPSDGQYITGLRLTRTGAVTSAADVDRLNADGGFAPGNQPYFYSAGPSGKVGMQVNTSGEIIENFNADNVYAATPEFDRSPAS